MHWDAWYFDVWNCHANSYVWRNWKLTFSWIPMCIISWQCDPFQDRQLFTFILGVNSTENFIFQIAFLFLVFQAFCFSPPSSQLMLLPVFVSLVLMLLCPSALPHSVLLSLIVITAAVIVLLMSLWALTASFAFSR